MPLSHILCLGPEMVAHFYYTFTLVLIIDSSLKFSAQFAPFLHSPPVVTLLPFSMLSIISFLSLPSTGIDTLKLRSKCAFGFLCTIYPLHLSYIPSSLFFLCLSPLSFPPELKQTTHIFLLHFAGQQYEPIQSRLV